MAPHELILLQQALAEVSKHPETQARIFNAIRDAVFAIEMNDEGVCRSCVNDKCVTGAECVTLGRDDSHV
jgi:hypothetical protein